MNLKDILKTTNVNNKPYMCDIARYFKLNVDSYEQSKRGWEFQELLGEINEVKRPYRQ